jgi:hypothetical protein
MPLRQDYLKQLYALMKLKYVFKLLYIQEKTSFCKGNKVVRYIMKYIIVALRSLLFFLL